MLKIMAATKSVIPHVAVFLLIYSTYSFSLEGLVIHTSLNVLLIFNHVILYSNMGLPSSCLHLFAYVKC